MENKKYEMTDETIEYDGHTLHRIKALRENYPFCDCACLVNAGDLGGFIEDEKNLSAEGDCWVGKEAKVYGDARVEDDAWVTDQAIVCDDAKIKERALATGQAIILEGATLAGAALVSGHSVIGGCALIEGRVAGWAKINGSVTIKSGDRVFIRQAQR